MFGFSKSSSDSVLLDILSAASLKAYQKRRDTGENYDSLIVPEVARVAKLNKLKLTKEQERMVTLASAVSGGVREALMTIEKGYESNNEDILNLGISDYATSLERYGVVFEVPQVHSRARDFRQTQKRLSEAQLTEQKLYEKMDRIRSMRTSGSRSKEEVVTPQRAVQVDTIKDTQIADFFEQNEPKVWPVIDDLSQSESSSILISQITYVIESHLRAITDKGSYVSQTKKAILRCAQDSETSAASDREKQQSNMNLLVALFFTALHRPQHFESRDVREVISEFLRAHTHEGDFIKLQRPLLEKFPLSYPMT
ncbi:hypothetical protein [Methylophaga thiooxydans]|uniref:hypothetical protein n=1 Tax=Methylophaga thiooxydans TaxID=392484 RepID=UPI0023545496|nr:hypothetical protein [Methylophaga thiooxydans]